MIPEDELRRRIVHRIKLLAKVRQPEYDLPADSFLEDCARDIIKLGKTAQVIHVEAVEVEDNA